MKRSGTDTGWGKPGMILLLALWGAFIGTGVYTFYYAEGFSYFSTDPRACVNCHIMQPQYDSWQNSSHHAAATCVDCHLPHDFVGKYIAKAENGYHHSKAFTFQNFHEPIQITEKNHRILEENCVHCHKDMTEVMLAYNEEVGILPIDCTHCHLDVGHGERVGLGGPVDKIEKEARSK